MEVLPMTTRACIGPRSPRTAALAVELSAVLAVMGIVPWQVTAREAAPAGKPTPEQQQSTAWPYTVEIKVVQKGRDGRTRVLVKRFITAFSGGWAGITFGGWAQPFASNDRGSPEPAIEQEPVPLPTGGAGGIRKHDGAPAISLADPRDDFALGTSF